MSQKLRIGIIDDHRLFRSGVEDIINDSIGYKVIVSASNSKELYSQLSKKQIDVLLLDIKLKEENGLDILMKLREEKPDLKIIMLTMHNEPTYINTMVQKGAHGYLMKDTTPEELLHTIKNVHEKGMYYDTYTTNILIESMQSKEKLDSLGIELSPQEIEMMTLISEGKTSEEISEILFKSGRTVDGYRRKLLDKTNTKNIAELVAWGFKNKFL